MAFADQAGKQSVDEAVAQLPAIEAFINKELTAAEVALQSAVTGALGSITTTVAEALAAITAERTECVSDAHALLDRLDGLTIQIHIPKRT